MIRMAIFVSSLIFLSPYIYANSLHDCLWSMLQVDLDSASEIKMGSHGAKIGNLVDKSGQARVKVIIKKTGGGSQDHDSEVLAYELSEILELRVVPPTIKRNINGDMYSIQQYVDHDYNYSEFWDEVKINQSPTARAILPNVNNNYTKVEIFNILIGDNDFSKAEHVLVDANGFVFAIDKGFAFHTGEILSDDFVVKLANYFTQPDGKEFREQLSIKSQSLIDAVANKYGVSSPKTYAFKARLKAILDIAPGFRESKSLFDSIAEETLTNYVNILVNKKGDLSKNIEILVEDLKDSMFFKPGLGSPRQQEITHSIHELLALFAKIDKYRLNNIPIPEDDIINAKKLINRIHNNPQSVLNNLSSLTK